MMGHMPESASDTDYKSYEFFGIQDNLLSPYSSSTFSHGSSSDSPESQIPLVGRPGPMDQPARNGNTMEPPGHEGQQQVDPTLSMVHSLLSQVLQQAIPGADANASPSPDFLKIVPTVKTLGTYRFNGKPDPYKADAWLQCVEANFAATRCPMEFGKDVGKSQLMSNVLLVENQGIMLSGVPYGQKMNSEIMEEEDGSGEEGYEDVWSKWTSEVKISGSDIWWDYMAEDNVCRVKPKEVYGL
ncbi:unnamed protein product [Thlaspi arvense]|uniref:Uncharacterized protein n=1 Tax=Thlaspi arvense TaxID=13288 RepID=A0AAU9SGD2_THLAR|nr:unnamed protein product [Thlaspi arvense]